MHSSWGKIAHVDLSAGRIRTESAPEELLIKFLGGRGFGAKIMLENVGIGIDPLSPENVLVLATGPISNSLIPGSDRAYFVAKSPLTGLVFGSCMGGRFASSLRQAGCDALVISGKADSPKYILVSEGHVQIVDAGELMGRSPGEVLAILSTTLREFEVCAIGIAGENLVNYANIVHPRLNGRPGIAGRGGLGAVMGSKNLKAVVAQRGNGSSAKAQSNKLLREVRKLILANLKTAPIPTTLASFGTAATISAANNMGVLGTRNLRDEIFEYAADISGEELKEKYYRKNITCYTCPVACGKLCEVNGELMRNPEYETLYAIGSMLGIRDLKSIIRANKLCNDYGIDTISMGVTLAFAIECFERGIISKEEAAGHDLKFGDGDLLLSLVKETSARIGIGNLLAKGTRRMSEILGRDSWKYAYHAKGLEIPGHSARGLKIMSVGYATGTKGGSHQDARPRYGPAMSDFAGKVQDAIVTQHLSAVGDSLIQCRFVMESGCGFTFSDTYSDLLEATTGWRPTPAELTEIGERICNAERIFNVREGISRKDDTLPYRVMTEGIPRGPLKGEKTSAERLQELLDSYYQMRNWDKNGIPSRQTLERLGLEEYWPLRAM